MIKSLLKIDLEKDKTKLALITSHNVYFYKSSVNCVWNENKNDLFLIIFIVMESRNRETKNAQAIRSNKQL